MLQTLMPSRRAPSSGKRIGQRRLTPYPNASGITGALKKTYPILGPQPGATTNVQNRLQSLSANYRKALENIDEVQSLLSSSTSRASSFPQVAEEREEPWFDWKRHSPRLCNVVSPASFRLKGELEKRVADSIRSNIAISPSTTPSVTFSVLCPPSIPSTTSR